MNLAWFGNTAFEIDVSWLPVLSPQGALVGLALTKQISKSHKLNYETLQTVDFLSNFRMSSSLAQT